MLAEWSKLKGTLHGLLFATCPFNLTELYVLAKDPFAASNQAAMRTVVLATRGFPLNEAMPHWDKHNTLKIPQGEPQPGNRLVPPLLEKDSVGWISVAHPASA
ncbi:MAG: hypothetical protein GY794_15430 [bacterium]|nr:hypothetical protein [bacterium]